MAVAAQAGGGNRSIAATSTETPTRIARWRCMRALVRRPGMDPPRTATSTFIVPSVGDPHTLGPELSEHHALVGATVRVDLRRREPQPDLVRGLLDGPGGVDQVSDGPAFRIGHGRSVRREVPADGPRRGEHGERVAHDLARDAD